MRSQYANDDVPTYVEFKFLYRGKTYIINRSPRQNRRSKRRNKEGEYTITTDQPRVSLIMPDGQIYKGNIRETNQKIIEIIGLDVNQFTQIAMIAQGDFLKLLHASSKERKEIFGKIFNTKIYWLIEEELKRRASAISATLEDNKKAINRELENVQCIKDSRLTEKWQDMKQFMESDSDKQLELIELIISEAKERENEINNSIQKNQEELEKINSKLMQAKDINNLFEALELAHKKKEELDLRKDQMDLVWQQIDRGKKALQVEPKEASYLNKQRELSECSKRIEDLKAWLEKNEAKLAMLKKEKEDKEKEYKKKSPILASKISNINELLPKYEQLDKMTSEIKSLKEIKAITEEKYDKADKNVNKTKENKENLIKEQEELKSLADRYTHLELTVKNLDEKINSLKSLINLIKQMKSLLANYNQGEKDYKAADEDYDLKCKHYENLYHNFIEGQAGILATSLEEGSPCPVCGSTSHPNKAVATDLLIDESKLREAKKQMDEAAKLRQAKNEVLQKAEQEYKVKRNLVEHEGKRIVAASFNPDQVNIESLQTMLAKEEEKLQALTTEKNQAKAAGDKYTAYQTQLKDLEAALESYNKEKEEANKALGEVAVSLTKTETITNSLKEALVYENKSHALNELAAAKEQMEKLDKAKAKIADEYQAMVEVASNKKGNLKAEEKSFIRLTEEVRSFKEAFYNELEKQGFSSVEDYHKSLISSQKIEELSQSYQSYRDEIIENDTNLKNYTMQTQGKSRIETKDLENRKSQLTKVKTELEDDGKYVYGIIKRNQEIYDKLTKLIADRKKTKNTYGTISRLSDTANGKLSKRHINFQTYIQRRYFNMILAEANKRLYTMSNNQFILKCRDMEDLSGQGEVGLDLDVYSMVNDQVRDVKTLSGGESFMAALSMALGMSDIIQNTAGRIHIDTMFIDEGFGSLSENTRMQAIKILNDLSGGKRLVGIISHVTELKAQIETKLLVTKGEKGSRARWEIS
jgi:exonuclease SbcC